MGNDIETRAAIEAADREFERIFGSGDAAGVAGLYTEDAKFLVPNSAPISGRQAIQATFQAFMDMGVKTVKLGTDEVEDFGDTASEVGTYALEDADGNTLDHGKFLVLWKQVDGEWKLYRDMINTSMPAPE